jgi:XRE family transcriptional regulator, aerobic/anaerobic benzoate catabolism transcriptional regulator
MDDAPLNKLIPAVPRPADESGAEPRRKPPCAAEVHADYLARLGERVRGARARRGMTRKMLARDSGVSERYLAQLEAGQGNISIALLRQVADAMGLPLADLVRDGEDRPIEFTLLVRRLERLGAAELAEAQRLVNARFGQERGAERAERIALVGLRGAGKSTLGRALAQRLGVPFVEMAKEIEAAAGMRIERIFDLAGQAAYRRYERRALERVLERHGRCVIAAGGSIVSEPATYDLLLDACFTVWVQASPEEHMARVVAQGDMRPMAGNAEAMEDLRRILAERQALYAKADARLDTTGKSVDAAVAELLATSGGVHSS